MDPRDTVFAEKAEALLEQMQQINFENGNAIPGGRVEPGGLVIPFYNEPYRVSSNGVTDPSGRFANPAVSVLLMSYVINHPRQIPPEGDWIGYREFEGSGPLAGHFSENINKIIETSFAGKADLLEAAALSIGGLPFEEGASFDVSMQFWALPRIPILLRFNDRENPFPAQCSLLFRQSAISFLDLKAMGVAGTFLTGKLIQYIR